MYPIRCFTCGKILKREIETFLNLTLDKRIDFFEKNKINRMCCRRMYLTCVSFDSKEEKYTLISKTLNTVGTVKFKTLY